MQHALHLFVRSAPALAALLAVAACGGGGDDAGTPINELATVSSATPSASTVMFSKPVILTVSGTHLGGITVSSTGCTEVKRLTEVPYVSSDTLAYYRCTSASATGAQTFRVARTGDGGVLKTADFTVPMPKVAMTVSNDAGVNGTLVVSLAADKTPITVKNFLDYVNAGFYDGTVIHRVSPNFVIQGGGYAGPVTPTALPDHKPTRDPIPLEVNKGLSNVQWTIAMARTNDPNSATSEFFINLANNTRLDPSATSAGYAVFGDVAASADVVQSIVAAPCQAAEFVFDGECLPVPNVTIKSAVQTQ